MQLFLRFTGNRITLPFAYHYEVQSLIYKLLSSNSQYSAFLHNDGYELNEKSFKLFTFGDLVGKYSIESQHIVFEKAFSLQIRTCDHCFAQAILSSFMNNKLYSLCGNAIVFTDYNITDKSFSKTEATIRTLSPITVYETAENSKTLYYSPDSIDFYNAIISNAKNKFSSYYKDATCGDIFITPAIDPAKMRKTVTKYKGTYINAWSGSFKLQCSTDMLNFLYNTGIGAKNSQGFGMFEIEA